MIDLLNRIGFRQIAFGGEGGGGGGGARGMLRHQITSLRSRTPKNIMNQPHKLAYITPQEERCCGCRWHWPVCQRHPCVSKGQRVDS
jgi:hypothetical protein